MSDDDPRWGDDPRERGDARDRDPVDARDVFLDYVDLPRSPDRELVHDRDRGYTIRESESRTLSTVTGALVTRYLECFVNGHTRV